MNKPNLSDATYPNGLHKKQGYKDPGTVEGTHIKVDDVVTVTGSYGTKPTIWSGKVTKKLTATTFETVVEVSHLEEPGSDNRSETVYTMVRNQSGESDPVKTENVPTIAR